MVLGNTAIPFEECTKYQGIFLAKRLLWRKHDCAQVTFASIVWWSGTLKVRPYGAVQGA